MNLAKIEIPSQKPVSKKVLTTILAFLGHSDLRVGIQRFDLNKFAKRTSVFEVIEVKSRYFQIKH